MKDMFQQISLMWTNKKGRRIPQPSIIECRGHSDNRVSDRQLNCTDAFCFAVDAVFTFDAVFAVDAVLTVTSRSTMQISYYDDVSLRKMQHKDFYKGLSV